MKKNLIFIFALIVTMMATGCEEDKVIDPIIIPDSYTISFVNLPDTLTGFVGLNITQNVEVFVTGQQGVWAVGVPVEFLVSSGIGSFTTRVDTTDANGRASRRLNFGSSDAGQCRITILVKGLEISRVITVSEYRRPKPVALRISGISNPIYGFGGGMYAYPIIDMPFNVEFLDSAGNVVIGDVPYETHLNNPSGEIYGRIDGNFFHTEESGKGEWLVARSDFASLASQITDSVQVDVIFIGGISVTAEMAYFFVKPDSIITDAISVQIVSSDGEALPDIPVELTTDLGSFEDGTIITDVNGTASGLWSNDRQEGTATIRATIAETDLMSGTQIYVRFKKPINSFYISASKNVLSVGDYDHCIIRATPILDGGDTIYWNQSVEFEVDSGDGYFDPPVCFTNMGVAESVFHPGTQSRRVRIHAMTQNYDMFYVTNWLDINILPGPPAHIDVTVDPDTILTGSNEPINVTATCTDLFNNPVSAGTLVRFSVDNGDITPSALTDERGKVTARLLVNLNDAGITTITAFAGEMSASATLVVLPNGMPRSILLRAAASYVPIDGQLELTAQVRTDGNLPVDQGIPVVFQALNVDPVNGAHFPNGQATDSSLTDADGNARLTLSSGAIVGGLLLKCYTWHDPETRLDTLWSPINSVTQVVAGTPYGIDVDILDNQGEDAGGGSWRIPVVARVFDRYLNPVADNIPVGFSVVPDDAGSIDAGFTGNEIGNGSTQGVAYTWLIYHGSRTFDPVTINAEVQGADGVISAARQHLLPPEECHLTLTVDPQNWMFDRGAPEDTCLIRVTVVLTDGHNIQINNAPVLFRTDRARLYWRIENDRYRSFYPEAARRYTTGGSATVYLRGRMSDFYLDDFTLEVTVHIEASVEGYDIEADPGFVFITRH